MVAEIERNRLFALIEELVKWENTINEQVLEAVRADAPVTAVQGGLFETAR